MKNRDAFCIFVFVVHISSNLKEDWESSMPPCRAFSRRRTWLGRLCLHENNVVEESIRFSEFDFCRNWRKKDSVRPRPVRRACRKYQQLLKKPVLVSFYRSTPRCMSCSFIEEHHHAGPSSPESGFHNAQYNPTYSEWRSCGYTTKESRPGRQERSPRRCPFQNVVPFFLPR